MKKPTTIKNEIIKKLIAADNKMSKSLDMEIPNHYENSFYINTDNKLVATCEYGDYICDYYGEFNNGEMFINPILEKIAKDNGYFWEWENSATIILYKI